MLPFLLRLQISKVFPLSTSSQSRKSHRPHSTVRAFDGEATEEEAEATSWRHYNTTMSLDTVRRAAAAEADTATSSPPAGLRVHGDQVRGDE